MGVYNDERPHYALKGQTPEEAYKGIGFDKDACKRHFQEAYIKRIKENKEARCRNCDDGGKFELVMA